MAESERVATPRSVETAASPAAPPTDADLARSMLTDEEYVAWVKKRLAAIDPAAPRPERCAYVAEEAADYIDHPFVRSERSPAAPRPEGLTVARLAPILTDAVMAGYIDWDKGNNDTTAAYILARLSDTGDHPKAAPLSVETAASPAAPRPDDLHGLPLEDVLRWVFAQYQVIPDEPKVVVLGWAADASKIIAEKMRKAAAEHVGRSPAAPRPEGLDELRDLAQAVVNEAEDYDEDGMLRPMTVSTVEKARRILARLSGTAALAAPRSVETAGLREALDRHVPHFDWGNGSPRHTAENRYAGCQRCNLDAALSPDTKETPRG